MPRVARVVAAATLSIPFALAGCATLFSGTSDTLTFESQPAGALVVIEGVDRGRTPLTTSVSRDIGGTDVMYRLDGYETRTFELGQEFNTTAIWGIFCFPLCPVVDVLTGAIMKYDPTTYSLELTSRDSDALEEILDVEEVLFQDGMRGDAGGLLTVDRIRPNVALVSSTARQIAIFR